MKKLNDVFVVRIGWERRTCQTILEKCTKKSKWKRFAECLIVSLQGNTLASGCIPYDVIVNYIPFYLSIYASRSKRRILLYHSEHKEWSRQLVLNNKRCESPTSVSAKKKKRLPTEHTKKESGRDNAVNHSENKARVASVLIHTLNFIIFVQHNRSRHIS